MRKKQKIQNGNPEKKVTKEMQKKIKNKQSAKKTRNKKKIYVELLESKIRELEGELNFIKSQSSMAKSKSDYEELFHRIIRFK